MKDGNLGWGGLILIGMGLPVPAMAKGRSFEYQVVDVPNASYTQIHGIDGGELAGCAVDARGHAHGFYFDGDRFVTLDILGASDVFAYGIDEGRIVGACRFTGTIRRGFCARFRNPER